MGTYVLIHGGFHDGSAWNTVVARLEKRGHTALAPTLTGRGKNVDPTVGLDQCSQSVVEHILTRDLTAVVLVGHSVGATVICKVAEAIPERIRRLVFYAGVVPRDGESIYDGYPPALRLIADQQFADSSDGTITVPFEIWRDSFMSDAAPDLASWAYQYLWPEPCRTFQDRVDLRKFHALQTPRTFLLGADDCTMPGGWHPQMTGRVGQFRLVQMPGGHELMFSNPHGLADNLIDAAED
ncbi:alpha/beta fold hydrolase [Mycobacterium sp. 1423905.2]|uniref:alpha/beta fold hydrolase n=1 Tax=Mycobacterium sp. 1423905.2 TaxID=1856859 RepID=UPI0007FDBD36|nr:alpha/beta hydrolase [Mycobacterium sp. 1423905.2]OBJ54852.1 salicylate esterase [Mycobacterium sp. 1423905.2]